MSRYLVDRIDGLSNVEVLTQAEVSGLEGHDGMLEAVRWRQARRATKCGGRFATCSCSSAPSRTRRWLSGSGVALDAKGFVLTGADLDGAAAGGSHRALETSRRGVFAIGDVRSGSVKRVAAAVGEGAQVVATLHAFFAGANQKPAATA